MQHATSEQAFNASTISGRAHITSSIPFWFWESDVRSLVLRLRGSTCA